jgi:tetratricopeptide (TPR) repeat protein
MTEFALSTRRQPLRTIALGVVALGLVWLVLSTSLVAFLAAVAPQGALWLQPSDPEALTSLVERRLQPAAADDASQRAGAPGESPESAGPTHEDVRTWAEAALANDPLNARALRNLGRLAHSAGDEARERTFMQAAARRSIHEAWALDRLLRDSYERKDYDAALDYADALLRTNSRVMPRVLPVLGRIAEDPKANDRLDALLARNPPWRAAFLSALPRAVSDARTPLRVLLALREAPSPPTLADIRDYVNVLAEHKLYELAYYTWLQFLPSEQLRVAGYLFNGSFEFPPSGLPFDWVMRGGTGATVDIVRRPDQTGERALLIELGPGRVELGGVDQTLLLPPGRYRFNAKYGGEVVGPRGLVWRVTCAGQGAPIGQSAMMVGLARPWKTVEVSFTVPGPDCRAQQLRLSLDARMPSEQLVSGSVWYDELQIDRDN